MAFRFTQYYYSVVEFVLVEIWKLNNFFRLNSFMGILIIL